MLKRVIEEMHTGEDDFYLDSLQLKILIFDSVEVKYIRDAIDAPSPFFFDFYHVGKGYDDPGLILIEPLEELLERIDEEGVFPNPPVLYSNKNDSLGVDVKDILLREVVRAVLIAADGDYDRI